MTEACRKCHRPLGVHLIFFDEPPEPPTLEHADFGADMLGVYCPLPPLEPQVEPGVICQLCGTKVTAATVRGHFEDKHPTVEWAFERWPDGEQVFIDHALTPQDFS